MVTKLDHYYHYYYYYYHLVVIFLAYILTIVCTGVKVYVGLYLAREMNDINSLKHTREFTRMSLLKLCI